MNSKPSTTMLLSAGAVAINATAGRPPRASILAYSGGVMTVAGFGAVVLDLAGLELPASIPLLADHNASLSGVIGHGVPSIQKNQLLIDGTLSESSAAKTIIDLAKSGFTWQASVGVEPLATQPIRAGESISVNGQTIKAGQGVTLVKRGRLRETSILSIGADPNTTVAIAAKGNLIMNFDQWLQASGFDAATLNDAQRATLKASFDAQQPVPTDTAESERVRASAVSGIAAGYPELATRAIADGWDENRTRTEVLATLRASRTALDANYNAKPAVPNTQALSAAFLIHAGYESVGEKELGATAMQCGRDLGTHSMLDIMRASLKLENRDASGMTQTEMIRAAVSTVSLPNALGNAANKMLLQSYTESPATWQTFATIKPAANFKTQTAVRPNINGELEQVAADGELKHASVAEADLVNWNIDTFGKMLTLSRQDIINDDLGFFTDTATAFGRVARRSLSDLVWRTILANGASFFGTGNKNLTTGGPSALSAASLQTLIGKMRAQRGADDIDLDIMPRVLVVPPELEGVAKGLLLSDYVQLISTNSGPTGNVLKNALTLAVEPRISNDDRFIGATATQFYVFAGPADGAVLVGFLNGQESPTVEFFGMDANPSSLSVSWRVFQDYGVALADYRAGQKSAGA